MESKIVVFDMYTTVECAYKLLEEMAELYGTWDTLQKNVRNYGCSPNCVQCEFDDVCLGYKNLGEDLYDVLQVCANLAYKVGYKTAFEGRPSRRSVDKEYMHGMLGSCAEVFHYVLHGSEQEMVEVVLDCLVRDVFTIANAYGIDMEKAIERGTEKNLRRGRH